MRSELTLISPGALISLLTIPKVARVILIPRRATCSCVTSSLCDWSLASKFNVIEYGEEGEYHEYLDDCKWYFPEYDNKLRGKTVWSFEIKNKYPNFEGYDCKNCGGWNCWVELDSGEIMCLKCNKDPYGKYVKEYAREYKLNRLLK